jgi:hypothetical protein
MNRRNFLSLAGAASVAPLVNASAAPASTAVTSTRQCYELRTYFFDKESQQKGFEAFMKDAAIPVLNQLDVRPVGVFYPTQGFSPAYVVLPFLNLQHLATVAVDLQLDHFYKQTGAAFLDAPATEPAFKRIESSIFLAFSGMPKLEVPAKNPGRVFQLRIYESPSAKTGAKKIEMFNDAGEIKIFREVGLNPVFFGEALVGSRIPNLTYMLGFASADDQKAAWGKFGQHPEWQKLRGMAEYSDKAILSNITNIDLIPAPCSQI